MTYTSDNIVGVEFTVKGGGEKVYKIGDYGNSGSPVISWLDVNLISFVSGRMRSETEAYTAAMIAHNLNNRTWIPTPKK